MACSLSLGLPSKAMPDPSRISCIADIAFHSVGNKKPVALDIRYPLALEGSMVGTLPKALSALSYHLCGSRTVGAPY